MYACVYIVSCNFNVFIKSNFVVDCIVVLRQRIGAGEMAQWLRAVTALPKVPSSNPSNHMVAHNHP